MKEETDPTTIKDLQPGVIVYNRLSGTSYIISDNYGNYAVAVRTLHISNPSEWVIVQGAKQRVRKPRKPRKHRKCGKQSATGAICYLEKGHTGAHVAKGCGGQHIHFAAKRSHP